MKKIFLLINFIFISIISYGLNFSVAPTKFEIDLEKLTTSEVYIINNTTEPMRLETYLENDKDFGEEFGFKDQLMVYPKKIAIKGGASQTVRFRVKPSSKLPDGELKTYIVFKESPQGIKFKGKKDEEQQTKSNISILTEIGIPVYGYKGEQIIKGDLKDISVKIKGKNVFISAMSESLGNTSLKFLYEVDSSKLKEKLEGKLDVSARTGKRKISNSFELPEELKGQKIKIVIKDQTDKVYYNGEKQL